MGRLYQNIQVYHLAYALVLDIYHITKTFPKLEEQNITSQLRRAAVSIPLNIAEGSAKASAREFAYFLNVAYASAKEVEVLLCLCRDLSYFSSEDYDLFSFRLEEVNAKLYLFTRTIESKIKQGKYQFFRKFEEKKMDDSNRNPSDNYDGSHHDNNIHRNTSSGNHNDNRDDNYTTRDESHSTNDNS